MSAVATDRADYQRVKERAKKRSAERTLAGQDIAPIPPRADPERRAAAGKSFRLFCETYFSHVFYFGWSDDHLRVVAKIERVILNSETLAIAMPRGSGKTTLCLVAVLWAILYGYHAFVELIASTSEEGEQSLDSIKTHLKVNNLLLADFPEAVYPIRRLEGESRRCNGQRYYGVPTGIAWSIDELVMPAIPGSKCSGSIIRVSGIMGAIRGALYVRPDGTQIRPTLAICDDPQTDQSAASVLQTRARLAVINGAISGLAGPGEATAIIIPCTVIQAGDLADTLLDRDQHPEWHGERTKMVYAFPTNTKLWDKYAQIRSDDLKADGDGSRATEFYRKHRKKMDAGSTVAWPERFKKGELSALQHGMNLRLKDEPAFFAEYQNEPMVLGMEDVVMLTADEVVKRTNARRRGVVPIGCESLTMFVDVHDRLLYYVVVAWERDFTGYVIDYGSYPDQRRAYFTLRDARVAMSDLQPGVSKEAVILAGLKAVIEEYLRKEWRREDGTVVQIGRCLVDSGYVPDVVFDSIRQSRQVSLVMPSLGVGLGAANKPFSEYRRVKGDRYGHHWRMPSPRKTRSLRTVNVDVNYWKSFVHARLNVAIGDQGALTIFGRQGGRHRLFAEHLTAEFPTQVENVYHGRRVDEWRVRPGGPDNHWFDGVVGCAVAASMLGCELGSHPAGTPPKKTAKKKKTRVSYL